jgi:hypothetical protein
MKYGSTVLARLPYLSTLPRRLAVASEVDFGLSSRPWNTRTSSFGVLSQSQSDWFRVCVHGKDDQEAD